jgi:hypothetical protein
MPNYSRSHLGRFIRKMFAQEIERELRMLEEYVLDEEVSDDVGESLMSRDEDYEPPEVPFHPKPTSVSILAIPDSANDFSGDSNHTTMPKAELDDAVDQRLNDRIERVEEPVPDPVLEAIERMGDDIHGANTVILAAGRGRSTARAPRARPTAPQHPGPKAQPTAARPRPPHPTHTEFEDDLHSAPTMIIDVARIRGRGSA